MTTPPTPTPEQVAEAMQVVQTWLGFMELEGYSLGLNSPHLDPLVGSIAHALSAASRVPKGYVRTPDGDISLWSTLRSGLTYCHDLMIAYADSQSHEAEIAFLDAIACKLESHAIGDIRKEIKATQQALDAGRGEKR